GKVVEPRGVGVSVRGDVEPLGSRGVNLGNDFRHVPPAWFAANLEMPDFDGNAGFTADAQRLVDSRQNAGAFVAHVSGVNAAEPGSLRGEGDQLVGLGVRGGSVFERSGNAHGTIAHGLAHDSPHLLQLPECRLDVVVAEYHAPDARGAYIAGNVDPGMLLFEAGNMLAKS